MKKIIYLLFTLLFFFLIPGSGTAATVLKIATLSPEGSFEVEQMRAAAKKILNSTDQRVKFKFYPGGVMGNDQGVLRKIRFNQLQGAALSSGALAGACIDTQIYCLPFLFKNFDEVDYVRKKMDQQIIDSFKKGGFTVFGIAEGGFAHIMSNEPVKKASDLKDLKVWIPEKDSTAMAAVKAFDITPIPLSLSDVRTGLQTGLIDTVAVPPTYALVLQWHTQIKYITKLPMLYTYGILAVNSKAFNKIAPDDRTIVSELMGEAFKKIDQNNRLQNSVAMETLEKMNIKIVEPDAATMGQWSESSTKVASNLVKNKILTTEMLQTLDKNLNDFRSGCK